MVHLADRHLADQTIFWSFSINFDHFRSFLIIFEKCIVCQMYRLPNVHLSNVLEPLLLVLHSGLQQPASLFFMKYRYRSLSYSHIGMIHSDTYEYFLYNCNLYSLCSKNSKVVWLCNLTFKDTLEYSLIYWGSVHLHHFSVKIMNLCPEIFVSYSDEF